MARDCIFTLRGAIIIRDFMLRVKRLFILSWGPTVFFYVVLVSVRDTGVVG